MKKEHLALLLGYLRSQRKEIERLFAEIEVAEPQGNEKTVYLGYCLHNLYCAFEDLFKEIARTFENQIGDVLRYHRELLKRMSLGVPSIRPDVLSKESYIILDELRRFRHTFRHAYTYDLDSNKVGDLKQTLLSKAGIVMSDLEKFEDYLKAKM